MAEKDDKKRVEQQAAVPVPAPPPIRAAGRGQKKDKK